MKPRGTFHIGLTLGLVSVCCGALGCSTTSTQAPMAIPEVPEYTKLSHPLGTDVGDLRVHVNSTPKGVAEKLAQCEKDYLRLDALAQSKEELQRGCQELVSRDPSFYHDCFYFKLLEITDFVHSEAFIQDRQKKMVEIYGFLSATGQAFRALYHDSRYLRAAVTLYKKHSEIVFYRKVDLTPEATLEYVMDQAQNFTYFKKEPVSESPVLEKYGLVERTGNRALATEPSIVPETAPAPAVMSFEPQAPGMPPVK